MKPIVLVYSTDPEFFLVFGHILTVAGFDCRLVEADALSRADAPGPLALIMDCKTEDAKAAELGARFKVSSRTPVAALLAPGANALHVKLLASRIDETFVRPFAPERLLVWLQERLGGATSLENDAGDLVHRDFRLERRTHRLFFRETELDMPPIEFRLLRHLMADPGKVFTREDLIEAAWPEHAADADIRSVDVHIARLRKRLKTSFGKEVIRTVRSAGYAFAPDW